MKDNYILEICVDSVESALAASEGGANRLELCSNLIIGGTTPGKGLYKLVRRECDNKIHVLIRPRAGDFCYSTFDFEIIKEEVKLFRELGADGIVIGILKPDGTLDIERIKEIITLAGDMSITLSRAFDMCMDPFKALEEAKEIGINTILTSGQKDSCLQGAELINSLVERAGDDIDILIGGGVTPESIKLLYDKTGARSYHMSGKVTLKGDMNYFNREVNMGLSGFDEYELIRTDRNKVIEAREALENIFLQNK